MFWEFGFHTSSAVDDILSKEDCTLEELLDEDNILQECRGNNKKLLDFLTQPWNLDKMLSYVLDEPSEDLAEKEKFKYPNMCCELLSADAWPILDALVEKKHLDRLWATFSQDGDINPLIGSFVVKILCHLFSRKTEEMANDFQAREGLMGQILTHISLPATSTLLAFLLREEAGLQDWLLGQVHLIEKLMDLYAKKENLSIDALDSVTNTLDEIMVSCRQARTMDMDEDSETSPVLSQILREESVSKILGFMFEQDSISLQHGLRLLIAMISEPPQLDDEATVSPEQSDQHQKEIQSVFKALAPSIHNFHDLLGVDEEDIEHVNSVSGVPNKQYGFERLTATLLIRHLVACRDPAIDKALFETKTLHILLNHFLTYADNNLLHKNIYEIVLNILQREDPNDELYKQLFTECDLISILNRGFRQNEEAQKLPKGHRLGFMGFLIQICGNIKTLLGKAADPFVLFYSTKPEIVSEWKEIMSDEVDNLLQTQSSPLGGKPPAMSLSSDDDDFFLGDNPSAMPINTGQSVEEFKAFLSLKMSALFPDSLAPNSDQDDNLIPSYGTEDFFSALTSMPMTVDIPEIDTSNMDERIPDSQMDVDPRDEAPPLTNHNQQMMDADMAALHDESSTDPVMSPDVLDVSQDSVEEVELKTEFVPLSPKSSAAVAHIQYSPARASSPLSSKASLQFESSADELQPSEQNSTSDVDMEGVETEATGQEDEGTMEDGSVDNSNSEEDAPTPEYTAAEAEALATSIQDEASTPEPRNEETNEPDVLEMTSSSSSESSPVPSANVTAHTATPRPHSGKTKKTRRSLPELPVSSPSSSTRRTLGLDAQSPPKADSDA